MTPFNGSRITTAYAAVAGLTIIVIAGLESYALSQGVDGTRSHSVSSGHRRARRRQHR